MSSTHLDVGTQKGGLAGDENLAAAGMHMREVTDGHEKPGAALQRLESNGEPQHAERRAR